MEMPPYVSGRSQLGLRAEQLYQTLRPEIESPENIGKIRVIDAEFGDFEIDEKGIEASRRLQIRHPKATLYAIRIGYTAIEALGGILDRARE